MLQLINIAKQGSDEVVFKLPDAQTCELWSNLDEQIFTQQMKLEIDVLNPMLTSSPILNSKNTTPNSAIAFVPWTFRMIESA